MRIKIIEGMSLGKPIVTTDIGTEGIPTTNSENILIANDAEQFVDAVVKLVAARCTEPESGGRMIDAILTNTVLPRISRELLERISQQVTVNTVILGERSSDLTYEFA